jgi:hypothetical protein
MTSPAKLRQRLSRLREEYADLLELAFATSPLWRGRVHDLARRCGKPTCRCVKGDLHVSPVLEDRSGARTRNLTLHGEDLHLFRRLTDTRSRLMGELALGDDMVVLYSNNRVAYLTPLEHQEALLTLPEDARRRVLAKTRKLRERMLPGVDLPRRPDA